MVLLYKRVDKIKSTVQCSRGVYVNPFPNCTLSKLDSWLNLTGCYFGEGIRRNLVVWSSIIFLLWIPLKLFFYERFVFNNFHTSKTHILVRGSVFQTHLNLLWPLVIYRFPQGIKKIKRREGGLHKSYM